MRDPARRSTVCFTWLLSIAAAFCGLLCRGDDPPAPLLLTASLDVKHMVLLLVLYMVNGEDLHGRVCVRGDLVRAGLLHALEGLEMECLTGLQGSPSQAEAHLMSSIVDKIVGFNDCMNEDHAACLVAGVQVCKACGRG